jgi:Ca2+:H+ antiporter
MLGASFLRAEHTGEGEAPWPLRLALVGGAAEMALASSAPRKNRPDLNVGCTLGSASQIALCVAPVLVLLSSFVGPTPMTLRFQPGAMAMGFVATPTASLVTNSGRSTWFGGVLVLTRST